MVRDRPAGLGHTIQCAHLHLRVHQRPVSDQSWVCDCSQLHHRPPNQRYAVELHRLDRLYNMAALYEPTSTAIQVQPGQVGLANQYHLDGIPGFLLHTGVLSILAPTRRRQYELEYLDLWRGHPAFHRLLSVLGKETLRWSSRIRQEDGLNLISFPLALVKWFIFASHPRIQC